MIESTTYILCTFSVTTGSRAAFLISSTLIVIWAANIVYPAGHGNVGYLRTLAYLNQVMDSMLGELLFNSLHSDSMKFVLIAQNWKSKVGFIRLLCRPNTERGLVDLVDESSVIKYRQTYQTVRSTMHLRKLVVRNSIHQRELSNLYSHGTSHFFYYNFWGQSLPNAPLSCKIYLPGRGVASIAFLHLWSLPHQQHFFPVEQSVFFLQAFSLTCLEGK